MNRTSRAFYWKAAGACALVFVACHYLMNDPPSLMVFVTVLLVSVGMDRFHDLGRSGKWALALIAVPCVVVIPIRPLGYSKEVDLAVWYIIAGIEIVALGLLPGQPGANRYGEPDRPARV